ncbi:uncharacterized protein LOC123701156 [Colias croceus]|uniref:uncharacterized protein LOC123701156 n=1 Tax=Colias crocea TaxID=72248 RepID=UPI001E27F230|nr:uncharacterized protein LOC123701156 [Colias croceus]
MHLPKECVLIMTLMSVYFDLNLDHNLNKCVLTDRNLTVLVPRVQEAKVIKDFDYLQTFRGGRLTEFVSIWKERGAPEALLKIITGYKIPFQAKPPLVMPRHTKVHYQTVPSVEMDLAINNMLTENILQHAPETPSFLSTLFLTPKSDGSMRPIFNLKRLNQYVKITKFRLISVHRVPDFLQPHDFMVKIDLTQAYCHVPVAVSHRCFLRLMYKGQMLQMTCLPFGLATAPKVFASLTNWTAEFLREKGIRIIVFLDDFLIVCQDRAKLVNQVEFVLKSLQELGWKVNTNKSILSPQTSLEYLGIVWDTWQNRKSLPQNKIRKIKVNISHLLKSQVITLKEAQSTAGFLNFARLVIPQGRLNFRCLLTLSNRLLKHQDRTSFHLPQQVVKELKWWLVNCEKFSRIHPPSTTHFLTTDAADSGWGAELNGIHMKGEWVGAESLLHSNQKEMLTVVKCLREVGPSLIHSSVLLQCDNKAVVAYLKNEGGCRSAELMKLTYEVYHLLDIFDIHLIPHHIPGSYNMEADRLSRNMSPAEWHLLPSTTDLVFAKWDLSDVDLFTSTRAHVVPKYVSLDQRDRQAWKHNAFAWEWTFRLAWVFPPPSVLPRVLMHLNRAKGMYLIVAPRWPRAFWRADLKSRAIAPPFTVRHLETKLIDLTTGLPPPKVKNMVLEIWKCGGGRKKLLDLGMDRRNLASVDNLFVTVCGKAKAASRTVIAGWVKSALREAGVEAAPGSVRSAVASRSWLDNESIDKILARGNWRSQNTFKKYYRKEITPLSPKWRYAIERRIEDERKLTMDAVGHGAKLKPGQFWNLSGTFLFAVYVMTALGFGAPVPHTIWGRTSGLIYAALAIPTHIYLMVNASTCFVINAEAYIQSLTTSFKRKTAIDSSKSDVQNIKESSNCSRHSGAFKPSRNSFIRKNVKGCLNIFCVGRGLPFIILMYYALGVVAFGLLRNKNVLETIMFPLEFTTTGGLEHVESYVRVFYGLYIEGAMWLLACTLATLRRCSSTTIDDFARDYRLFVTEKCVECENDIKR